MAPEKCDERTVRIGLFIRMLMVAAVNRDPAAGTFLQTADTKDREAFFSRLTTSETAMREETMEAEIDTERAEDVEASDAKSDAAVREEIGYEGQERDDVNRDDAGGIGPANVGAVDGGGERKGIDA